MVSTHGVAMRPIWKLMKTANAYRHSRQRFVRSSKAGQAAEILREIVQLPVRDKLVDSFVSRARVYTSIYVYVYLSIA